LREIAAMKETAQELTAEEIRARITSAFTDIPALLRKAPELAKAKLAQHVDQIRMLPQSDRSYEVKGRGTCSAPDSETEVL
jgi:hypothetical protein